MARTLEDLTPFVEHLMAASPLPVAAHWISHDEEGDDTDAESCAYEVAAEVVLLGRYGKNLPDWTENTPETVTVRTDFGSSEEDGCRTCDRCGAMLFTSLTTYGVESELDHFEEHGISTPREWREVGDIIEGIEFVESAWFPGSWMTPQEIERKRKLYARTIALIEKNLPSA